MTGPVDLDALELVLRDTDLTAAQQQAIIAECRALRKALFEMEDNCDSLEDSLDSARKGEREWHSRYEQARANAAHMLERFEICSQQCDLMQRERDEARARVAELEAERVELLSKMRPSDAIRHQDDCKCDSCIIGVQDAFIVGMRAELTAARAVVEYVRTTWNAQRDMAKEAALLRAYDAARGTKEGT